MQLVTGREGSYFVRADGATVGALRPEAVAGLDGFRLVVVWKGRSVELGAVSGTSPEQAGRMVVDEYRRRVRRESEVAR